MSSGDVRLTATQAAARAGIKTKRWYEYVANGKAPQHDGVDYPSGESGIGRHGVRWWWQSTVDTWIVRPHAASRPEEHGTTPGYHRHKHRREQPCEPCRAAWAERQRQRRNDNAAKGLPPDDPRHGTLYAYNTFNCRCPRCFKAAADRRAARPTATRSP